jgi:hypothetical protein
METAAQGRDTVLGREPPAWRKWSSAAMGGKEPCSLLLAWGNPGRKKVVRVGERRKKVVAARGGRCKFSNLQGRELLYIEDG